MRLKGRDSATLIRLRKELQANGYFPHYHKIGRIKMEVRFTMKQPKSDFFVVVNVVTGELHEFRRNGSPKSKGTRGRLVGALIHRPKVRNGG